MARESKICTHCGRRIEPRRMSDHDWEALRYCSRACRARAGAEVHVRIESAIRRLLSARAPSSSICPSDAAREVFGRGFRAHMEDTRAAARRMAHRGEVVVTQRGRRVDPAEMRGPVRVARGPRFTRERAPGYAEDP